MSNSFVIQTGRVQRYLARSYPEQDKCRLYDHTDTTLKMNRVIQFTQIERRSADARVSEQTTLMPHHQSVSVDV
jgi:hypothetical protein